MKCARCHRDMSKPAGYVAGLPLGPTCLRMIVEAEHKIQKSQAVRDEKTIDMFDDKMKNG